MVNNKTTQVSIEFQKSKPIYYPGENLVGNIKFKINEKLKISEVKCLIDGQAHVHWSQKVYAGRGWATRHFEERQKYIKTSILLYKHEDNEGFLEAGDYVYPFKFILPIDLPTSFEHELGRIYYSVIASVKISWSFDEDIKKSFTVISPLDLNKYPSVKKPYGVSTQKVFCCGPCTSNPISVNFSINKSGFVPGEIIPFVANIENKSNKSVKQITVKLVQLAKFEGKINFGESKTLVKTSSRILSLIENKKNVEPNSVECWNNGILKIPPTCASSNGLCDIINVSYVLYMSFETSSVTASTDLRIPITIGTKPLRIDPIQNQNEEFQGIPDIDMPPDYKTCTFGMSSLQVAQTDTTTVETDPSDFVPEYPFYDKVPN